MKLIGLTGSIATGKSSVARMFEELGCYVIDADELVHSIYEEHSDGYIKIVETFGENILDKTGKIDRKKLFKIVANDKEKLKILENIVHPLVERKRNEFLQLIKQKDPQAIVINEIPLLFEKNMQSMFDCVIVVWTDKKTQIERLRKRNQIDEDEILKRISMQIPIDKKKEMADIVIDNSQDLANTLNQVKNVLKKIKSNEICNK